MPEDVRRACVPHDELVRWWYETVKCARASSHKPLDYLIYLFIYLFIIFPQPGSAGPTPATIIIYYLFIIYYFYLLFNVAHASG